MLYRTSQGGDDQKLCVEASCVCVCLDAQTHAAPCDPMDYSLPGSSVNGGSLGENTGVGCHALLQGIFPTQGSNLGLPTLQAGSLTSEPPGKPS